MQITGMLHGARLLQIVGFPTAEVLGPDATEEEIKALIDRHGQVFVKPVFKGGVGKKGKAGLLGRAKDLKTALAEKERLYFVEHQVRQRQVAKANGVTFEAACRRSTRSISRSPTRTEFRAPTMTLTHHGGMDIEELDRQPGRAGAVQPAHRPEGLRRRQRAQPTSMRRRRSSRRWSSICRTCGSCSTTTA